MIETRVYIRKQCLLSEDRVAAPAVAEVLGALAAIFVPLLIKTAIGGVSAALKKAGSDETLQDSGRLPTYLYQLANNAGTRSLKLNPDLGGVLVVRGKFNAPDPDDQSKVSFPEPGIFLTAAEEAKRIARLRACNIPIEEIALLYEAAIKISDDKTALYYESRFLEVNSFQKSGDTRGLAISIALNGAGTKEGDGSLSLAIMNLGEIKKGQITGPQQLRSQRSSWLGSLGMTAEAVAALEKLEVADNEAIGVMPVTIEGTLAETKEGNKILAFIADVLDSTKDAVTKTVSDEILKDRGKEAAAAADAVETARQEEEAAYSGYLEAKANLAGLKEDATAEEKRAKEFEVEKKKRAWCVKFKTLQNFGVAPVRSDTCP